MVRRFGWTQVATILTAAVLCGVGFAGAQTETGTGASDATEAQQSQADAPAASGQAVTQGAEQDLTPQTPDAAGEAARDQTLLTDPEIDRAAPPDDAARDAAAPQDQFGEAQRGQDQRSLLAGLEFGQATDAGIPVTTVGPGTLMFESGLRPGDVIISYDGRPIRAQADLERVAVYRPGERVPMTVLRSGREETLYVIFPQAASERRGAYQEYEARRPVEEPRPPMDVAGGPGFLGVGFDTRFFDAAVVRDVLPGTAAEQAGLRVGDAIVAINGQAISSFPEAMSVIRSMRAGDEVDIEFSRRVTDQTRVVLGTRPGAEPREAGVVPSAEEETREYRDSQQYEAPPATPMPAPDPPAPESEAPMPAPTPSASEPDAQRELP